MKPIVWMGSLALLLMSCAKSTEVDGEPDTPIGSLTLNLTGTDSAGVTYWLRSAQFEISGYPDFFPMPVGGMGSEGGSGGWGGGYPYYEVVSSDDYPDDSTIRRRLVPGSYNIGLMNSDWYLERSTEGGARERVEKVVLLSSQYQYAYVWDGGQSIVNFRFGVDGDVIDFRSGELQIGVEIEKPGEHCPGGGFGGFWGVAGGRSMGDCGSAGAGSAGVPAPIP